MARRRVAGAFVLAAGSLVAGAAFWRARTRPRERVDVYFGDGSMVSFAPGTPAGDRLVPLARRVLAAARG